VPFLHIIIRRDTFDLTRAYKPAMRTGLDSVLITCADRFSREMPGERRAEMALCTATRPLDAGTCISNSQDQYTIAHVPA